MPFCFNIVSDNYECNTYYPREQNLFLTFPNYQFEEFNNIFNIRRASDSATYCI